MSNPSWRCKQGHRIAQDSFDYHDLLHDVCGGDRRPLYGGKSVGHARGKRLPNPHLRYAL
jgi:hypothetical protein